MAERLPVYRARQTVALTLFDPERCFEAYEALFALSREQGGAGLSAEAARRIPILARSADQVAPAVVTAVGADGLFRPPLDDAPDLPAAASPAPSVEAHHA